MIERDADGREWVRLPGYGRVEVTPPEGMPNMPLDMRIKRAKEDLDRYQKTNDHLTITLFLMAVLAVLVAYWAITGAPMLID